MVKIPVLVYLLCALCYEPVFGQADSVKVKGNTEAEYLTFSGNRTGYPAAPAEGEIFYNASEKTVKYFDGAQWRAIGAGGASSRSIATRVVAAFNTPAGSGHADYVCTGSNDQGVINQAINDLGTKGGTVYLAEGTYNISGPITIAHPRVSLIGAGKATILKLVFGSSNIIGAISVDDPDDIGMDGIYIARLCIDGNGKTGSGNNGVFFDYINYSHLEDLWIENLSGYGIYFGWSNNNTISGCRIVGCSSAAGINLTEGSWNIISNNIIGGDLSGGITHSGIAGAANIIYDNHIYGAAATSTGLSLGLPYNIASGNIIRQKNWGVRAWGNGSNCIVSNNTVNDSLQYGIVCEEDENIFSGNALDANLLGATFHSYSGRNIISSNLISNDRSTVAGSFGMRFDASADNLVLANRIWGTTAALNDTYGILLQTASSTGNFLSGNLIDGARYEKKIEDSGSNNQYLDKAKLSFEPVSINIPASCGGAYTLTFNQGTGSYMKISSSYGIAGSNVNLNVSRGQGIGSIIVLENVSAVSGNRKFTVGASGPVHVNGGSQTLDPGDTIMLLWNGNKWLQLMLSKNS